MASSFLTPWPPRSGCHPPGVHQLVANAGLDALDAALGELRTAGWPAPEDPDPGEDTELGGRDSIAGRLSDEVSWLRQCADWLAHLDADSYPASGDVPHQLIAPFGLTWSTPQARHVAAAQLTPYRHRPSCQKTEVIRELWVQG